MRTLFFVVLLVSVLAMPVFAGTWHALAPIPIAEGSSACHTLVYDNNGHLYATGGLVWLNTKGDIRLSSEFFKYDIQTNTWAKMSNSPDVTEHNVAVYVGNDRIIMNRGNSTDYMFKYNINSNSWNIVEHSISGSFAYNAGAFDGVNSIFYTGGLWDNRLIRYDLAGNTWNAVCQLPENMSYNSMVYQNNGKLYLTAGSAGDPLSGSSHFYEYDIAQTSWTRLSDIPIPTLEGTLVPDGRGGLVLDTGMDIADPLGMYRYDITGNTWSRIGDLPEVFYANAAAFDGRDSIYYTVGKSSGLYRYDMEPVPEPSSLLILGSLVAPLGFLIRRKRG